jgi:sucrose phosphorylase
MAGIDQIRGVMLNAYPDSIGGKLEDIISLLELPIFKDAFSFFYILPTFFHSDLDRGFCIIDYDINEDLASKADLDKLKSLGIKPKFDIVLNHLSVASPQFKDLLEHGGQSKYKDFFIDWNAFWQGQGTINDEGLLIPDEHHLQKLFMRKSGLPVLKVMFPDGKARYYWNTFYQKISYEKLSLTDLSSLSTISNDDCNAILSLVNDAIDAQKDLATIDFGKYAGLKEGITKILSKKRTYLGQMDVNAKSELVWQYYEDVLEKLSQFGCSILRLDAFAYLHKEVGMTNFFNKPGTWDHLARINKIAQKNGLSLLPEIHAEYGQHLHDEVSNEGYIIYDFFLPGLMIHTLEKADSTNLIKWGSEIISKGFKTVNMLGCHDGIPVLDLKGKTVDGVYHEGLLSDEQIDDIMNLVLSR